MSATVSKDWAARDANPILMEILTRLKEPENNETLLNKSLIIRPTSKFAKERKHKLKQSDAMYGAKAEIKKVQMRRTEIEQALVKEGIAPRVPIHKMDKINRNLMRSLLVEEQKKKLPE